jgi:hypothetical protein
MYSDQHFPLTATSGHKINEVFASKIKTDKIDDASDLRQQGSTTIQPLMWIVTIPHVL